MSQQAVTSPLPPGQTLWAALTLAVPCQGNLGGLVGQEKVSTLAQAGPRDPREALKGDAEEEKKLRDLMLRQPVLLPRFDP